MASLRCVGNKLLYPRVARNVHFSSKLRQDAAKKDIDAPLKKDPLKLKKGPTEAEKRVLMALKFSAAFFPGVYIGALCQRKGYFSSKKANATKSAKKEANANETSSLMGAMTEVPKKIEEKVNDLKGEKNKKDEKK